MTIRDIATDVALNLDHSGMVIAITEECGQLKGWYVSSTNIPLTGEIARIPLGLEYYDVLLASYNEPIELTYSDVLAYFMDDLIDDLTPAIEAVINQEANA